MILPDRLVESGKNYLIRVRSASQCNVKQPLSTTKLRFGDWYLKQLRSTALVNCGHMIAVHLTLML